MITNPTPIVTEAVPLKTYDELWIYSLNAMSPSTSSGSITIELLPYNRSLNELGPSDAKITLTTDKFFEALEQVPELAAAFQAVINAVPATRQWIADKAEQDSRPPGSSL